MLTAATLRPAVPVAVVLALLASCSSECPKLNCPASFVVLEVTSTAGGPLNAVTATLSGPMLVMFDCSPGAGDALVTSCFSRSAVAAGDYTLTVMAPGFQTATVDATVTEVHGCCPGANLQPSTVTLVALTPGP